MAAETRPVLPGESVAQLNWDHDQAYVQWTKMKSVMRTAGTDVVELADCLTPGSSGGGVFLDGVHVANNWSHSQGCVEGIPDKTRLHSRAALNSAELLAAGGS